jgi:hypothetical protein
MTHLIVSFSSGRFLQLASYCLGLVIPAMTHLTESLGTSTSPSFPKKTKIFLKFLLEAHPEQPFIPNSDNEKVILTVLCVEFAPQNNFHQEFPDCPIRRTVTECYD